MGADGDLSTTDPYGRRVVLRALTVEARKAKGKHTGKDALSPEDAMDVVHSPHIIQESSHVAGRQVFYQYEREQGRPPYKRTVVSFTGNDGECISWSRYGSMVKGDVVYMNVRR